MKFCHILELAILPVFFSLKKIHASDKNQTFTPKEVGTCAKPTGYSVFVLNL